MIRFIAGGHGRLGHGPAWLIVGCLMAIACPMAVAGGGSRTKAPPKDHYEGRQALHEGLGAGEARLRTAGTDSVRSTTRRHASAAIASAESAEAGGTENGERHLLTAVAASRRTAASGLISASCEDLHVRIPQRARASSSTGMPRARSGEDGSRRSRSFKSVMTHDRRCMLRTSSRNTPAIFGAGLDRRDPRGGPARGPAAEVRRIPGDPRAGQPAAGRAASGGSAGRGRRRRSATSSWPPAPTSWASRSPAITRRASEPPRASAPGRGQARPGRRRSATNWSRSSPAWRRRCSARSSTDRVEPWGYSVFEQIGCATCHTPSSAR